MKKLLLVLALCGSAHAEFRDGNKLLAEMNSDNYQSRSLVIGYLMGVADAYHGILHCAPPNATSGQMFDMVQNYLTNKPIERTKTGDSIVLHVLKTAWPCENKKGQSL